MPWWFWLIVVVYASMGTTGVWAYWSYDLDLELGVGMIMISIFAMIHGPFWWILVGYKELNYHLKHRPKKIERGPIVVLKARHKEEYK